MIDRPVTAEEMLLARENRKAHVKETLEETGAVSVILFTVVTPGAEKRCDTAKRLFSTSRRAIIDALMGGGIAPLKIDQRDLITGNELYIALYLPALDVKRRMCEMEDILPFGRLLNLNVYDAEGNHIPRTALGHPERCCLVCGKPGYECARTHAHSDEELKAVIDDLVEQASLMIT